MTEKDRKLLAGSALFAGLGRTETDRVLQALGAFEKTCEAGEILHIPGEPLTHFGIVLSGLVQVYRDEPDGTRLLMASNGPGGSFGESMCFLQLAEAPVTITAAEDSRVLWMSLDTVRKGCGDPEASAEGCDCSFMHDLTMRVMACFARRALEMNDRIQVLSQRTLRKKIMTLLAQYDRHSKGSAFALPLGREDMAVFLGCDRSALSRELASMKKDGLIDYYKNSFRVIRSGRTDKEE